MNDSTDIRKRPTCHHSLTNTGVRVGGKEGRNELWAQLKCFRAYFGLSLFQFLGFKKISGKIFVKK